MSVLVYTESEEGTFKKIAFEAVSYAKGIADMLGTSVTAISINGNNTDQLGKYGASKVLQVSNDQLQILMLQLMQILLHKLQKVKHHM